MTCEIGQLAFIFRGGRTCFPKLLKKLKMDEPVQEREKLVEEAEEPIGEQGAAQAVEEDVVIEEETTQGAK